MLAAVKEGNVEKLAELIRQDPGFKVNMDLGSGDTLLRYACGSDNRSPVIPLLLAHPDVDVNAKDGDGCTPFYLACCGRPSCVRQMLKDPRVKVNEPRNDRTTPLWRAAFYGHLDVIKWWISSGREMHLGEPGDSKTDAIGGAKKRGKTEVATLLERFKSDSCSQILLHCHPTSSGTANGAVLPPGGIRPGDHPRHRQRGGIQRAGKKTLVIPP